MWYDREGGRGGGYLRDIPVQVLVNHVALVGGLPVLVGIPAPAGLEVCGRHAAVIFAGAALLDDRAVQSAQQGAPGLHTVSSRDTVPAGGGAYTIAVRLLNVSRTSLSL